MDQLTYFVCEEGELRVATCTCPFHSCHRNKSWSFCLSSYVSTFDRMYMGNHITILFVVFTVYMYLTNCSFFGLLLT